METNNCEAARRFSVSEKLIRDRKQAHTSGKWDGVSRETRAIGRGATARFPDLERELLAWIHQSRQEGKAVILVGIRSKALELAKESRFNIPEDSFKASAMWCSRFLKRHDLSLRCRTTIAQRLPVDLELKLSGFHKLIIQKRKALPYSLQQIGNMDETPLRYDMPMGRSVTKKGEKSVLIKTTGHEKDHLTVVLTCLADGTKLPPVVIFKRKTMPKVPFPQGIIVRVHQKGWMDETGLADWVSNVWSRRPGGLLQKPGLLVWDSFRPHMSENIKKRLKHAKTDTVVIPGGLTPMVQPLDVSINKPFKDSVKTQWTTWMDSGEHSFTPGGAMRKPTFAQICEWIKVAWEEVKTETIVKAFKKCGISNAMDGTEDDALWRDSDSEDPEDPFADDSDSASDSTDSHDSDGYLTDHAK